MRFLFWCIVKQFCDFLYKIGVVDLAFRRKWAKPYYRQKMIIYSRWHNFRARKRVEEYFNRHLSKCETVIYTCLTGGYDELLVPGFINPECDYVCFTDDEKMLEKKYVGPWQMRPLQFSKLDNGKNNRWHKMHPHALFPDYEKSIYIDSNVNFKTDKIFEYIKNLPDGCFIALPHHAIRDCLYDEAKFVIETGLDDAEKVEPLMKKYHDEGFPEHFGLAENNVIFRHHNVPACIKLMEDWWNLFCEYSRRDQLSLFYLLWRDKINFAFFSPDSFKKDHKNFRIYKHKR